MTQAELITKITNMPQNKQLLVLALLKANL